MNKDLVRLVINNPNLSTYGEAHTAVKINVKMVLGKWVTIKKPYHIAKLNKDDAIRYYKIKFNKYWLEILKNELPLESDRVRFIKAVQSNTLPYRRACFKLKKG